MIKAAVIGLFEDSRKNTLVMPCSLIEQRRVLVVHILILKSSFKG